MQSPLTDADLEEMLRIAGPTAGGSKRAQAIIDLVAEVRQLRAERGRWRGGAYLAKLAWLREHITDAERDDCVDLVLPHAN